MTTIIAAFFAGFSIGWWLKAMYYKRCYLLRTRHEWLRDPRVSDIDAQLINQFDDDDANTPWWTP